MKKKCLLQGDRYRYQQGLTLVEILVALTLSLVVTAMVLQIFFSSKLAYLAQEQGSRIQENGSYVIELMSKYIRMTGYRNDAWIQVEVGDTFRPFTRNTTVCGQAINFSAGQVIVGFDNVGNNNSDCIMLRYRDNTDGGVTNCFGTNTVSDDRALDDVDVINWFFLNNNRELLCGSLRTGQNSSTPQPFVNNVDDMQILYGVINPDRTNNRNQVYLNATEVNDNNLWNNVVSVKIALLLSSDNGVNITAQEQPYIFPPWRNDDDPVTTPSSGDFRLRRVFTTTINLRNRMAGF